MAIYHEKNARGDATVEACQFDGSLASIHEIAGLADTKSFRVMRKGPKFFIAMDYISVHPDGMEYIETWFLGVGDWFFGGTRGTSKIKGGTNRDDFARYFEYSEA